MSDRITLRIDGDVKKRFVAVTGDNGTDPSGILRQWIYAYLKQHEPVTPIIDTKPPVELQTRREV